MSIIILLFAARQAFSEWQHSQQAYGDLMALNGHLLADIGLDRWQISAMFGERIGRRRQCPCTSGRAATGHRARLGAGNPAA